MCAKKSSKQSAAKTGKTSFLVAGVGASAGGLHALEKLLSKIAGNSGMAYVIVTHHHEGHASLLPDLLAKHTMMTVKEATDGMKIEPDTVYIAPTSGQLLVADETTLGVRAKTGQGGPALAIDTFFRSMAENLKARAVGIILSGSGSDGTLGLKAIKEEGGMVMAQEPGSAGYPGMPFSAIATGGVDYILPPVDMPERLELYAQNPFLPATVKEQEKEADVILEEATQKVFWHLRNRTGHDFASYKQSTIRRRIQRRMAVHQLEATSEYVRLLRDNPHEIDMLFKELLIGVTHFYRDFEMFNILSEKIIPKMLAEHPEKTAFRVWVPGCGSGEEPYTLAMVITDCAKRWARKSNYKSSAPIWTPSP